MDTCPDGTIGLNNLRTSVTMQWKQGSSLWSHERGVLLVQHRCDVWRGKSSICWTHVVFYFLYFYMTLRYVNAQTDPCSPIHRKTKNEKQWGLTLQSSPNCHVDAYRLCMNQRAHGDILFYSQLSLLKLRALSQQGYRCWCVAMVV